MIQMLLMLLILTTNRYIVNMHTCFENNPSVIRPLTHVYDAAPLVATNTNHPSSNYLILLLDDATPR